MEIPEEMGLSDRFPDLRQVPSSPILLDADKAHFSRSTETSLLKPQPSKSTDGFLHPMKVTLPSPSPGGSRKTAS